MLLQYWANMALPAAFGEVNVNYRVREKCESGPVRWAIEDLVSLPARADNLIRADYHCPSRTATDNAASVVERFQFGLEPSAGIALQNARVIATHEENCRSRLKWRAK